MVHVFFRELYKSTHAHACTLARTHTHTHRGIQAHTDKHTDTQAHTQAYKCTLVCPHRHCRLHPPFTPLKMLIDSLVRFCKHPLETEFAYLTEKQRFLAGIV